MRTIYIKIPLDRCCMKITARNRSCYESWRLSGKIWKRQRASCRWMNSVAVRGSSADSTTAPLPMSSRSRAGWPANSAGNNHLFILNLYTANCFNAFHLNTQHLLSHKVNYITVWEKRDRRLNCVSKGASTQISTQCWTWLVDWLMNRSIPHRPL